MSRPVAQLLDPLFVGVVERDGLVERVAEVVVLEFAVLGEGHVERGRDGLLELRASQALGLLGSLAEARELVGRSLEVAIYEPRETGAWEDALGRFSSMRGRQ